MNIDITLLNKCISGDDRAIALLYKECFAVMKSIAIRYQYNNAEVNEAINTGFLKVVNGLTKYDPEQSFTSWLKTIAINSNIDLYRKKKVYLSRTLPVEDCAIYERYDAPIYSETEFNAEQLLSLVNQLPPVSKKVFNLFAIDGYSHKEIGLLLNMSIGTSKWHLSNARKKLKEELSSISKSKKIAI